MRTDGRTDRQTDMTKPFPIFLTRLGTAVELITTGHIITEVHTHVETSCLSSTPKTRENIQLQQPRRMQNSVL